MQFRHEVKYEISNFDMLILRQRLKAVMQPDENAQNGIYEIRSLYFDNIYDKALREKIDGVNIREKFRIRLYNKDKSLIRLERKYKHNALGNKTSAILTEEQTKDIICGKISWMAKLENEVLNAFYVKLKQDNLRPKVIVDYTREPFVFGAGNVRVTLDYNLRTSLSCTDFLNFDCVTVPAKYDSAILEVKWDNYLPDVVKNAVQLENCYDTAFSKYAISRMYD